MAPTPEPAVLLIPAVLFTWLALRTSVSIYALCVVAFGLVIAWCHSCHLFEDFLVISAQLIIMIMVTSRPIASRSTLQKEDVAQLEFLDALYILTWDGVVHLVNSLTQTIAIDSWCEWHDRRGAGRFDCVARFVEMSSCCGYKRCRCHRSPRQVRCASV